MPAALSSSAIRMGCKNGRLSRYFAGDFGAESLECDARCRCFILFEEFLWWAFGGRFVVRSDVLRRLIYGELAKILVEA